MGVLHFASSGVAIAAGAIVAASEWGSPTGVAAIGTLLIAAGTLAWSIYSGVHQRQAKGKQIDIEAAAELIELMERHHREKHDGDEGLDDED